MKQLARIAALAALGLLITWGGLVAQRAAAHSNHPGLQFSIDIKGLNDCTTKVRDPTCTLATGSTFTLEVRLDAMGDGVSQYEGYDLVLDYTGVTPNQDANMDDWPDCGFPATFYGTNFIGMGCAVGVPPAGPSSYLGVIGKNTFKCTQSGTITLPHDIGKTDLVQTVGEDHSEVDTEETINIVCGTVPTGQPGVVATATEGGPRNDTPEPRPSVETTATAAKPTLDATAAARQTAQQGTVIAQATAGTTIPGGQGGDSPSGGGNSKAWIWVVVGIAGVLAVVGAAGGWRYMSSRGGGGGTPST